MTQKVEHKCGKCGRVYDAEEEDKVCPECGHQDLEVVILCGGEGTRMRDFGEEDLEKKMKPEECPHKRFYVLKVRCEQCGKIIDEPFGTSWTLRKEEQIGIEAK